MSFQAPGGAFPGAPGGPPVPRYGAVPPTSAMYPHSGAGPPMYAMAVAPPGYRPGMPGTMGQPGILPMPHMPPMMLRMQHPVRPQVISAPPQFSPVRANLQARIPVISPSAMKVATTVFVGNISEKSSDTLLRQILLRCGRIEGWKRVQDASGKLQGFGFCEYGDPESTLRALRILHDFKLGDKNLVVKVDSKTRTDLLKYMLKKKRKADQETVDEATIEKEVVGMDEKKGTELLKEVTDDAQKETDGQIIAAITALVRENVEILGDDSSRADAQLEKDVKEALFAIAKQKGKIDPNCTLDDMDMEEGMKTLVSDEIKKFRLSSERHEVEKHKFREKKKMETDGSKTDGAVPTQSSDRESKEGAKGRGREGRGRSPPNKDKDHSPAQRPRSPVKRRSRTPSPRTRARERQEREATRREKEKEESLKEEESYEARQLQRKHRVREKAYKERLTMWEARERRKAKEYDKDYEKEEQRKEEMEKEGKDLAEFLEDYNDEKDDQRYYKGSQFARRRRERELEKEEDERDRQKEKEEIEALRLEVMERQVKESKRRERVEDGDGSTGSSSPQRGEEEEEDVDLEDVVEMEGDIPLAKTGFNPVPSYPPIQVQSAPAVDLKSHPRDSTEGDGITFGDVDGVTEVEDMETDSPRTGVKMSFGVWSKLGGGGGAGGGGGSNGTPLGKRTTRDTNVLGAEEEGEIDAPKKKLASIQQIEKEQRDERRGALEREVSEMAAKYSGDDRRIPPDEKKKMIQTLVKGIPTTKEELFEYELKWDAIDQTLMEKRIGPWINKKIVEYIGEEEQTLTEFICNKLSTHIPAQTILEELAMVLDEEAEVFVVKLWRLLIYETEAKTLGIAKSY